MIRVTKVQKGNNVCLSVIPKDLCKELDIKKGDTIVWEWTKKSKQITIIKVVEEDDYKRKVNVNDYKITKGE